MKSINRYLRKKLVVTVVCGMAVLFAFAIYILEKKHVINISKDGKPVVADGAKTTSTTPTAQSDFNSGEQREPGNSIKESQGTGGIFQTTNPTMAVDTTNPTESKTGEITIYSPQKNTEVKSGVMVAGASTLAKISYRLIDSVSGMIAQGELTMTNGKFSGNLNFITTAKEGRLDIYATRADGAEYSTVELPLRFK